MNSTIKASHPKHNAVSSHNTMGCSNNAEESEAIVEMPQECKSEDIKESYRRLLQVIQEHSFVDKCLDHWNQLYDYYNVHLCEKQRRACVSIEEMLQKGHRYFGCVDGQKHYCQVCPIIIGTDLDLRIRKASKDEWYSKTFPTYVLHSGFFSNISQYITNNVGNAHKFQSRTHTTGRIFLVDKNQHSYMLYIMLPEATFVMRTPNKEERVIEGVEYVSDLGIELCEAQAYLATMKLQLLKDFLNALRLSDAEIDIIENKIIITGSYFYQQALQYLVPERIRRKRKAEEPMLRIAKRSRFVSCESLAPSCESLAPSSQEPSTQEPRKRKLADATSSKAKRTKATDENYDLEQIRKKCLSGRLQFLVSKKKLYFSKNDQLKYINKQMTTDSHTPQSTTIFSNANETIVEEQANLIRRISSKKSKFLKSVYPTQSEGIINVFYLANLNSAGKSMNFTFHTRITFVFTQDILDYFDWLIGYLDAQPDGSQKIVFNNFIYDRKVDVDVWQLKLKDERINIQPFGEYLICNLQSGRAQRLLLVNGPKGYCSKCKLLSHQRFVPYSRVASSHVANSHVATSHGSDIQTKCHIWMSNNEIASFGTIEEPRYYELMCGSAINVLSYADVNDISKSISAVRTFRHHFNCIPSREINLLSNKELSRGYIIGNSVYINLFTFFYDYMGLTVQDGYLLNENVTLPIMIATKHSIMIKSKSKIYMEKLLQIHHYAHESEIRIAKLYSTAPIEQLSIKKVVLEHLSHSNDTYIYLVKLIQINNIVHCIDEKSIQLHVVNNKSSLVLHVSFKTKEGILYPIKISNPYSQKGMCNIRDLSALKRANGLGVDIVANPTSVVTRHAIGQLKEIQDTAEPVYENGVFVGYGGYCKFFIPNVFPHDDIHGSELTNSMRLDRLTFDALIAANQVRAINILNTNHFAPGHWAPLKRYINLMNIVNVSVENTFNRYSNFLEAPRRQDMA